ncbi:T9SS type B sorting domain-containing protein [Bizionia sediminis]|uniref:T9SS type B sorting domain-containing protein n=1 Tax=Bizionia sediminis TaxID=1737064 RepID=A0ABW5KRU5_9FLAO
MKLQQLVLFLGLLISASSSGQNEAANWNFGNNASLNFSFGYPIAQQGALIDTEEGCSSISDNLGNLLFYSDGITVWNRNHMVMRNGTGLLGNKSATQSALIVPKPNDDFIYYIFTVDDRAGTDGLRFSEIDMRLDNGLGALTDQKNILLESPVTEKITAIESSDGRSIWVIAHKWQSNQFISFLISETGVNQTPVISAVGSVHGGAINKTIGYLKASPNREKVVSARSYTNSEVQIFDFDATQGILSNPVTISNYNSDNIGAYGCEFSPDSTILYISEIDRDNNVSSIYQYNLALNTETDIINSATIIAQESSKQFGALQQAIDGRIYVAVKDGQYLAVITNPNTLGTAANFELNGVYLEGNTSQFGLPPFIQSYFFATNIFRNTCFGNTTEFNIDTSTVIDSITWDFGDPASGSNNTATVQNPTHVYTQPGQYVVTITIQTEGETQVVYRSLTISEQPEPLDLAPLVACSSSNNLPNYNLTDAIPEVILTNPNIGVAFYDNRADAENRVNAIANTSNYQSTSGNETLYVRLQNIASSDCFSISTLELISTLPPAIEPYETVFFCKNSTEDSISINVGNLSEPLSNYSFLWLESLETTPEISVTNTGTYRVRIALNTTITDENPDGCYAEREVTVSASSIATITNLQITDNSATVYVMGLGNYEYALDNPDGPYQNSPTFTGLSTGMHRIYVRDTNNCGLESVSFTIIGFPKFFTPNADGVNDRWQIEGDATQFSPNTKVSIFNRYGKLIKQLDPNGEGWDGFSNGEPAITDDYWFSVILKDGRVYKSHFTLKR